MDPLSLSASVIAVLQVTISLMKYVNDARNATSEQKALAVEAGNLYGLLTDLRFRVDEAKTDDPWYTEVKLLGVNNGPLEQLKKILESLLGHVGRNSTRSQIKTALTWKWVKSDVDNALRQIERIKSLITIALANDNFKLSQAIHSNVTTLIAQSSDLRVGIELLKNGVQRELFSKIREWLQTPDSSYNFRAALEKRHPHTGLWLLQSHQYKEWKKGTSCLLWIQGNAGCGKTILSATALQDIFDQVDSADDHAIAYFYFDFNNIEKQRSQNAVRSLLIQLAAKLPGCYNGLQELYQKCDDGKQQPSKDSIQALLYATLRTPERKFLVLDALDECTDWTEFLHLLSTLTKLAPDRTCFMVTSRKERDIEEAMKPLTSQIINVGSDTNDQDIRMYIDYRLLTDQRLRKWPVPVKQEIDHTLMSKADGMFRWVFCQLDALCKCIKLNDLRRSLSSLPRSLDETYARIIRQIETEGYLSDAINALRWLCFARRPLEVSEIIEVLAIQDGADGGFFPEERLPDPEDIKIVCSSLVACDSVDENHDFDPRGMIQLAHLSVKEYLLSERFPSRSDFDVRLCHQALAESCLYYLIHVHDTYASASTVSKDYPLLQYAERYWYEHAKQMGPMAGSTTLILAKKLLSRESLRFRCAVQSRMTRLFVFDPSRVDPHNPPKWCPPLYYVASLGLLDLFASLLNDDEGVENRTEYLSGALAAASYAGCVDIVQLLLDKGADVFTPFSYWGNILCTASGRGHLEIVDLLIKNGADVNGPGGYRGSALCIASQYGHTEVVKLLLSHGADVNSGSRHGSALFVATRRGHEEVVQILLDHGADIIEARTPMSKNALFVAVARGYKNLVKMFLRRGIDINWHENLGPVLYQAIAKRQHEIVQILLESGADVNIGTDKYADALQAATSSGDEKIVRMLLEKGADVNKEGGRSGTALQIAASENKNNILQVLLQHGANPNSRGGSLASPLGAAVSAGSIEVVKTLLASGAEVDARPEATKGFYDTALYMASTLGHTDIVTLLLDDGANINGQGGSLGPALIGAAKKCKLDAVRVLLERGADVNARSSSGRYDTALQAARSAGAGEEIVQLLLDHGATDDQQ